MATNKDKPVAKARCPYGCTFDFFFGVRLAGLTGGDTAGNSASRFRRCSRSDAVIRKRWAIGRSSSDRQGLEPDFLVIQVTHTLIDDTWMHMRTRSGFHNAIRAARDPQYLFLHRGYWHARIYIIFRVTLVNERPMANILPPDTFQETMRVPETAYRSAIAIMHNGRMTDVSVTFVLLSWADNVASYAAECPRCNEGRIDVAVPLQPDGRFAEPPACPMMCLECEDRMDAMLEPRTEKEAGRELSDRAGLDQFIRTMNIRSWD